jgi:hypothetical protein
VGEVGQGSPEATAAAVVGLFDFSQLKFLERDLLVDAIHAYRAKVSLESKGRPVE